MGKLLSKGKAVHHQQLDLNFENGTYLIKASFKDKHIIKKVILQ